MIIPVLILKDRRSHCPIFFIGLDDLISNKERAGRPKDLDDLQYLRRTQERGG